MIHDQSYSACVMSKGLFIFYKKIELEIDKEYCVGPDICTLYTRLICETQKDIIDQLGKNNVRRLNREIYVELISEIS